MYFVVAVQCLKPGVSEIESVPLLSCVLKLERNTTFDLESSGAQVPGLGRISGRSRYWHIMRWLLVIVALSACGRNNPYDYWAVSLWTLQSLLPLHLLFAESAQLAWTCSRVSILIVRSKVFWTNLREKRTRTVNATSLNLWSTATMVLTHQLEVLHGQLTRLSQVKLNPKKKSWSFVIDHWSFKKEVKVNP